METKCTTANKVKESNHVSLGFVYSLKAKTNIVVSSILMLFVGSVFFSCDKDGDGSITQPTSIHSHNVGIQETRSMFHDKFTVASVYKDNYRHYTGAHGIVPGFVSWWNCIANAEGASVISIADVARLGKGRNKTISVWDLSAAYPGIQISGLRDDSRNGASLENRLELYFVNNLNGGQPCAVLYNNNYNGKQQNVLVVVLTYQNGYVYYQDPVARTLGSTSISSFVANARAASFDNQTINVIHW